MSAYLVRLGITNCYLIPCIDGYIMVDAGSLRKERTFKHRLARLGIKPSDIKMIIITHAHYDHVGSLGEIKKMCSCPVLAHSLEAKIIEESRVVIPPGTNPFGCMVSSLGSKAHKLLVFNPVEVEIQIDNVYELSSLGVRGRVLLTPGHTCGSVSVVLDSEEAFIGDLAMNWIPGASFFPTFAEMPAEVYTSWDLILKKGIKTLYPAHGRPIALAPFLRQLEKAKQMSYKMAW